MKYLLLTTGDIRKPGDQVRAYLDTYTSSFPGYPGNHDAYAFGSWQPVRLLGHNILAADLLAANFRRPQ